MSRTKIFLVMLVICLSLGCQTLGSRHSALHELTKNATKKGLCEPGTYPAYSSNSVSIMAKNIRKCLSCPRNCRGCPDGTLAYCKTFSKSHAKNPQRLAQNEKPKRIFEKNNKKSEVPTDSVPSPKRKMAQNSEEIPDIVDVQSYTLENCLAISDKDFEGNTLSGKAKCAGPGFARSLNADGTPTNFLTADDYRENCVDFTSDNKCTNCDRGVKIAFVKNGKCKACNKSSLDPCGYCTIENSTPKCLACDTSKTYDSSLTINCSPKPGAHSSPIPNCLSQKGRTCVLAKPDYCLNNGSPTAYPTDAVGCNSATDYWCYKQQPKSDGQGCETAANEFVNCHLGRYLNGKRFCQYPIKTHSFKCKDDRYPFIKDNTVVCLKKDVFKGCKTLKLLNGCTEAKTGYKLVSSTEVVAVPAKDKDSCDSTQRLYPNPEKSETCIKCPNDALFEFKSTEGKCIDTCQKQDPKKRATLKEGKYQCEECPSGKVYNIEDRTCTEKDEDDKDFMTIALGVVFSLLITGIFITVLTLALFTKAVPFDSAVTVE